jgi:hypothetical protein
MHLLDLQHHLGAPRLEEEAEATLRQAMQGGPSTTTTPTTRLPAPGVKLEPSTLRNAIPVSSWKPGAATLTHSGTGAGSVKINAL